MKQRRKSKPRKNRPGHYDRGYDYTLGRRHAYWRVQRQQRRMRFLIQQLRQHKIGISLLLLYAIIITSLMVHLFWGPIVAVTTASVLVAMLVVIFLYIFVRHNEWFFC
jgi:hypothetical protein